MYRAFNSLFLTFSLFCQLWEESQAENTRLRLEMSSIRSDLDTAKRQLETAIEVRVLFNWWPYRIFPGKWCGYSWRTRSLPGSWSLFLVIQLTVAVGIKKFRQKTHASVKYNGKFLTLFFLNCSLQFTVCLVRLGTGNPGLWCRCIQVPFFL